MDPEPNADVPHVAPPRVEEPPPTAVDSADLLKGQREILIRHGADTYRLRLTRNGKLILHK